MDQQNSSTGSTGIMDKVRQGATTQLSTQKDKATDGIGTVAEAVRQLGYEIRGEAESGLPGPKGNIETFLWIA